MLTDLDLGYELEVYVFLWGGFNLEYRNLENGYLEGIFA